MEVNYSIGRILLLTYVIISSSQCNDLLSTEMKKTIQDNKLVQHFILLVMIMVLMSLFGNPLKLDFAGDETINLAIVSSLVYVWFILTTKLSVTWNFGVIILLCIYFFYENEKIDEYKKKIGDDSVKGPQKEELVTSFARDHKFLLLGLFGTTLIGTMLYANEQSSVQMGGGKGNKFNIVNFLMS
jgi:hypothetical protein